MIASSPLKKQITLMKKYYKGLLLIVLLFLGASSCKKFLNVVPDGTGTLSYAFHQSNLFFNGDEAIMSYIHFYFFEWQPMMVS